MSHSANVDQMEAEDWAGELGEKWLANVDRFEGMIAPVGAGLMAHAAFQSGERVVDIGCGAGPTTLEIARAVGPSGEVLGIDISPALIEECRRRAEAASIANARFLVADAAGVKPEGAPFDRLFSRFGSMFFPNPKAAFANLRAILRPGGRADLGVWAPPSENQWVGALMGIVGRHVELPPPVPHAPGPFALDDPDYVRPILVSAGFESIDFKLWRGEQLVGGPGSTPDSAAEFVINALSIGDALAEKPEEVRREVLTELTALFAQHRAPDGIRMGATAWFITAYAPA